MTYLDSYPFTKLSCSRCDSICFVRLDMVLFPRVWTESRMWHSIGGIESNTVQHTRIENDHLPCVGILCHLLCRYVYKLDKLFSTLMKILFIFIFVFIYLLSVEINVPTVPVLKKNANPPQNMYLFIYLFICYSFAYFSVARKWPNSPQISLSVIKNAVHRPSITYLGYTHNNFGDLTRKINRQRKLYLMKFWSFYIWGCYRVSSTLYVC